MNVTLATLSKATELGFLTTAIAAVAIADVLLKKAAAESTIEQAVRSPFLWGAIGLYLFQIVFLVYAFHAGWQLSAVGMLQTALYALIVLGAGVLLYRETMTPIQMFGVVLAVGGVILISWD